MKILVTGGSSNLSKYVSKVNSMHSKHKFEFVIAAGDLKGTQSEFILAANMLQLDLYFSGSLESVGRAINLGTHGILKTAAGAVLAYALRPNVDTTVFYDIKSVDILISSQWPLGISDDGSQQVAEVASMVQPRYHFAVGSKFFSREPYRNLHDPNLTTRFISVANHLNNEKERWFYAMEIGSPRKSDANPTDCPFDVSLIRKRRRSEDGNAFFWDESANELRIRNAKGTNPDVCKLCKKTKCVHLQRRPVPEGYICRICGIEGHHIRDCPHGKTAGTRNSKRKKNNRCWFCISNPDVESHLIITVLEECYVAVAKGGLVEKHLLVVPVMHLQSSRHMELVETSESKISAKLVNKEIDKFSQIFADLVLKTDEIVVAYEVYIGGDEEDERIKLHHMHIHFVAVPIELEYLIEEKFIEEAKSEGLEILDKLPENKYWPYCRFWIISQGHREIIVSPPQRKEGLLTNVPFNHQIARYVLSELLGKSDRVDWKKCILDEKQETELAERFREQLKLE